MQKGDHLTSIKDINKDGNTNLHNLRSLSEWLWRRLNGQSNYTEQEPNQCNKRDPNKNKTKVEQNPKYFLLCGKYHQNAPKSNPKKTEKQEITT